MTKRGRDPLPMSQPLHQGSPAAAYDADASFYAATFPTTEPEQHLDLANIDHWISQLKLGTAAPEVLDAGCGTGRMSRYLTDRGCRVRGVDVSTGMLRMAHRDHPDIETQVGSILALPHDDGSFDGAFYWYSIIHLAASDLPQVFAEARRVLQPGGLVLFAFQTGDDVRDISGGLKRRGHDVTLLRHHRSADEVGNALQAEGFDEVLRMVRCPIGAEKDGQAIIAARRRPQH